jgi:hypothetical protein
MIRDQQELPPTPDPPEGFKFKTTGSECVIEHTRTGMGCLNIFLTLWLSGWTVGCAFMIHNYVNSVKHMDHNSPIPLFFVLGFVIPWFIVAYLLLYLKFARKTFRLGDTFLSIETHLILVSWKVVLLRNTITHIQQEKDGGEGEDSFPSWGLKIKCMAVVESRFQRLRLFNNFGRNMQYHSLLYRLPYKHSEWLGIVIARWSGADLKLCPKPKGIRSIFRGGM